MGIVIVNQEADSAKTLETAAYFLSITDITSSLWIECLFRRHVDRF